MDEEKTKEDDDWKILEESNSKSPTEVGDGHDVVTSLRSDLAALQYKRDKLLSENGDLKSQMLSTSQRLLEQQVEIDHLREQNARQNAIISSLRKKIQDLEESQRSLQSLQSRSDIAVHTLERDNRYYEEKIKDLEKKLRSLELECNNEEQQKENARCQFHDLVRRLSVALDADFCDSTHTHSPETLIIKASELVQEITRLKNKCVNTVENLSTSEQDLRSCRDALERCAADKELLQRQVSSQLLDLERLRQEKESLAMQQRVTERELLEAREKLSHTSKNLNVVTDNVNQNESLIMQLKEDLRHREEKHQRLAAEFRGVLESVAILLSLPTRFVEPHEATIKDRIREILSDNKDKAAQIEALRDKLSLESRQSERLVQLQETAAGRARVLQDERALLEGKLHKLEAELAVSEADRDGLRKDKGLFVSFLERLSRTLNMDAVTADAGLELQADSLLHRAEQLARLESDKLVDKLLYYGYYGTLPRLRRERSFHDLPYIKETAVVYQLQRRIRILREQLQRKDLHLDLLRRKLVVQEEGGRARAVLAAERDEAAARGGKAARHAERLAAQLRDARAQITDLVAQLGGAAEYKITSLERARKIEELEKRLEESEAARIRLERKFLSAKDSSSVSGAARAAAERRAAAAAADLADARRREAQLLSFRSSVAKLLGVVSAGAVSDLELVSRLRRVIDAHRDFTVVSRRYESPARSPPPPDRAATRTPDRSLRYDDSGYADPGFELDDELYKPRL